MDVFGATTAEETNLLRESENSNDYLIIKSIDNKTATKRFSKKKSTLENK